MKRVFVWMLSVCAVLLCGCMQTDQPENQAYALIFGVDSVENDIEVSAQVLKGSGNSSDGDGGYMVASARGASYAEAMQALQAVLPRRINLNQTILIVASKRLAESERFAEVMRSMFTSYELDASAWFAVCEGSTRDYLNAQKPSIGTRMSIAVTAMLENNVNLGFIPDSTFADVCYAMVSPFSDPIAIHAALQNHDVAASVGMGSADSPESTDGSSKAASVYLGAALFRDGRMVGTLSGDEVLCLNLIRGGVTNFSVEIDGTSVWLAATGTPVLSVRADAVPKIHVRLSLSMEYKQDMPSLERVKAVLLENLQALTRHCQALRVEPFGYAAHAAFAFPTLDAWTQYDWREKFPFAESEYSVSIRKTGA